jgi:hypothetical protein
LKRIQSIHELGCPKPSEAIEFAVLPDLGQLAPGFVFIKPHDLAEIKGYIWFGWLEVHAVACIHTKSHIQNLSLTQPSTAN